MCFHYGVGHEAAGLLTAVFLVWVMLRRRPEMRPRGWGGRAALLLAVLAVWRLTVYANVKPPPPTNPPPAGVEMRLFQIYRCGEDGRLYPVGAPLREVNREE